MNLPLHLTSDCNMRCSYCYSPPHDGEWMTEAVGLKALELGASMNSGSCGIDFFGGEPLLQKELIMSLVERGREMERRQAGRFHFRIMTNGLYLDDDFLEFSVQNDIQITMSMDGIREAHDRHRRFPDGSPTFDIVKRRLHMLLAARPNSSVAMVVNPDTARYLSESVSFLLDSSCRHIRISLNCAAEWRESDFHMLAKEYRGLAALYIKWKRQGREFHLSPLDEKLWSHINCHCRQKERCELAQRKVAVDPGGSLFPCVLFTRDGGDSPWCIGNVYDGIDERASLRIHEESERLKVSCQWCAHRDRCNNSCGCLNWQTTGSINEVSPVMCRHEQMLIPLADRVDEILCREREPLFLQEQYNAA